MRVRPPWIGWKRKRNGALPSPRPRRPVSGRDYRINIIDTPGHIDFTVEVGRSLRVLDGAVALFSAVEGVEPQSETVWRQADRYRVPRIAFVNKMDRPGADLDKVIGMMADILKANPVALQVPIKSGDEFFGVVDLLSGHALVYDVDRMGAEYSTGDVPAHLAERVAQAREEMLEKLSEIDDDLMDRFLHGKEITACRHRAGNQKGYAPGKHTAGACAARRSRIGAFSRFSTQSSITCRLR